MSTVFGTVYGVRLDSRFTAWLDTLEILNFDAVSFAVPGRYAVLARYIYKCM